MSPALASGAAGGFVALLVVLLAAMLLAVIRAPGRDGTPPDDAGDAGDATWPLPAVPPPSRPAPLPFRPADAQARAAAVIARAAAVLPSRPAPGRQPADAAAMPRLLAPRASPPARATRPGIPPARSPGRQCPAARPGHRRPSPRASYQYIQGGQGERQEQGQHGRPGCCRNERPLGRLTAKVVPGSSQGR